MKTARPKLAPAVVRVAIYVRQSVYDARSDFGSIEAQGEAVEAFVRSQASLGWQALPDRFVDRGFSGKNTARPGFQSMMAAIRSGGVNVVAVHRLDRISRSLADLVGMLAEFREHGVEFVSTTQGFQTSTPVGRMTVNLLGTFAEFEREQISERTKAKVSAARRRGLWTGGPRVLGYDLVESRLVVNETEAATVRALFDTFLERRSIMATLGVAQDRGWLMKSWVTHENKIVEPREFTKATLRSLLSNPVYVGQVRLNDEVHPGVHDAIVARGVFDAVQTALATAPPDTSTRRRHPALLRGLLTCAVCGSTMRVAATRGHLSYVCGRIVTGGAGACPGSRIPAARLEGAVLDRVRDIGRDPALVDATVAAVGTVRAQQVAEAQARVRTLEADTARLERERDRLLGAVGGASNATVLARLDAIGAEMGDRAAQVAFAHADTDRLRAAEVNESELRALLSDFQPLWEALWQGERERLLRLMIRSIAYDGRSGEVTIATAGDA